MCFQRCRELFLWEKIGAQTFKYFQNSLKCWTKCFHVPEFQHTLFQQTHRTSRVPPLLQCTRGSTCKPLRKGLPRRMASNPPLTEGSCGRCGHHSQCQQHSHPELSAAFATHYSAPIAWRLWSMCSGCLRKGPQSNVSPLREENSIPFVCTPLAGLKNLISTGNICCSFLFEASTLSVAYAQAFRLAATSSNNDGTKTLQIIASHLVRALEYLGWERLQFNCEIQSLNRNVCLCLTVR